MLRNAIEAIEWRLFSGSATYLAGFFLSVVALFVGIGLVTGTAFAGSQKCKKVVNGKCVLAEKPSASSQEPNTFDQMMFALGAPMPAPEANERRQGETERVVSKRL